MSTPQPGQNDPLAPPPGIGTAPRYGPGPPQAAPTKAWHRVMRDWYSTLPFHLARSAAYRRRIRRYTRR